MKNELGVGRDARSCIARLNSVLFKSYPGRCTVAELVYLDRSEV